MKKRGRTAVFIILLIAVMCTVFVFSSQDGDRSGGISEKVARAICRVIFFRYDEMSGDEQMFVVRQLNYFVRKLAHFSVYMLMGMLSYSALLIADIQKIAQKWAVSLGICALYAAFDEIHQYFIPGRSMRFTDVLIDCSGALIGIAIVKLICITADHIKQNVKLSRKER